jgi:hypothetical protein
MSTYVTMPTECDDGQYRSNVYVDGSLVGGTKGPRDFVHKVLYTSHNTMDVFPQTTHNP